MQGTSNQTTDGTVIEVTPTYSGSVQTNYVKHPAFTFGDDELLGFWVAKFEPSVADKNDECYTTPSIINCDKINLVPKIVPNVKSWTYITIGNMFTVSLNMKNNSIYGWSANEVDTHMMKNTEWGAVAYLSKSVYGANAEVWINNSNQYMTGCGGDRPSEAYYIGCQYEYNTLIGQNASTTNNIYGVYDMSGGAYEYTAAYVNNAHANLITYGSAILDADIRYKNIYSVGATDSQLANYNANKNVIGDAIYETSSSYSGSNSWYGDSSFMPYTSYIWFARGGNYSDQAKAGLFAYASSFGNATTNHTFRPVVIVTK